LARGERRAQLIAQEEPLMEQRLAAAGQMQPVITPAPAIPVT
jgi:hypothetical protein